MNAIVGATCSFIPLSSSSQFISPRRPFVGFTSSPPLGFGHNYHRNRCASDDNRCRAIRAVDSGRRNYSGGEDDNLLDELDVATFLDPPKELIPFDPSSYNPAAYLWKKIEDIPQERRHRLLDLLGPRLVSRAWEVAGMRYVHTNLANKCASNKCASKLLSDANAEVIELWNCRTSGGPMPLSWFRSFKKALFCSNNGNVYGRLMIDGSVVAKFTNSSYPLYFMVKQCKDVLSTEQPCDISYELGDGRLDLPAFPSGFPRPAKHPYPLDDHVVIYIRHVGPGVMIGQVWQEGKELQQVPRKLCDEMLMVKECD